MVELGRTRSLGVWVRAVVTLASLGLVFFWLSPGELIEAMRRTGVPLWFVTVGSATVAHLAAAKKWHFLLGAVGVRTKFVEALAAHGTGLFANILLPLVGGDVVRAGLVTHSRDDLAAAVTGGFADRVSDLTALIALPTIALVFLPIDRTREAVGVIGVIGAGLALLLLVAGLLIWRFRKEPPQHLARIVMPATRLVNEIRARKVASLTALTASLVIQSWFVVLNATIGSAIGIDVPLATWFLVWPLAKIAALAPISLGGLGIREGALVGLMLPFGVEATLAAASSLVWQTVMVALGLIGGLASLAARRHWIDHRSPR